MTRFRLTHDANASVALPETPDGWDAQTFVLAVARGAGEETVVDTEPDTVLELCLDNGTRVLVAAEDASRYLGTPASRGDGRPGEIRVGPVLRPTGPGPMPSLSRDGAGAWVLRALRIYRKGPIGMTALAAAGAFQDALLGHRQGLFRCAAERWDLTPVETVPASDSPMLLLIHGTASSSEGSFSALWSGPLGERLAASYPGRVYAFEHRSLTDSPIRNALELVAALPQGSRLHIVSHSRGGMVGELLARADRVDAEPFSPEEIERFLAYAHTTGRKGLEDDAARLSELGTLLRSRSIRVERFVRVACPARGTTLASGRLDRWASVMLNLAGGGVVSVTGALAPTLVPAVARTHELLKGFLLALVRERTDARILPGLEAMMPDSPLVELLNAPGVLVRNPLHVLAGDFKGEGLLAWLGDCLSEAFYGGRTDLVVNTPSMSGGAAREQGVWQALVRGPEVHHLSYFRRDESAAAIFAALRGDGGGFSALAGPSREYISRSGRTVRSNPEAPILLMLPGLMGSHLRIEGDRVWFDPSSLSAGRFVQLGHGRRDGVVDGWMARSNDALAAHLSQTHEIRPFAYDWRAPLEESALRFGKVLDKALEDGRKGGRAVRILAHSSGGLVARLALAPRLERFRENRGSRMLQLGTPNRGMCAATTLLLGRDPLIGMLANWSGPNGDRRRLLEAFSGFPGVLALLPWPDLADPMADDGSHFDPATWARWFDSDPEADGPDGWHRPTPEALARARATVSQIAAGTLDPETTVYVAGHAPTPQEVRIGSDGIEIGTSPQGDGRVSWRGGIPAGVRTWYVDAAHGDLPRLVSAFEAYQELLETGRTHALPESPPQGENGGAVFLPAPGGLHVLYPSSDEVLVAALGERPPAVDTSSDTVPPVSIEVVHGSLAGADSPVLVGAYANDSLRGSGMYLDRRLGGRLSQALAMGRYPEHPGDAAVFIHPEPGGKPAGAVVVGLGPIGEILPGALTRALTDGLLEYARFRIQGEDVAAEAGSIEISALLVGTGYGGVSVQSGATALADAITIANRELCKTVSGMRIGRLVLFEEAEDRALAAILAFRDLAREARLRGKIGFDGRLRHAPGGYRRSLVDRGGADGWHRVHITESESGRGALHFTLVSGRARNEVDEEPCQRQAVDGLIDSAIGSTVDQPGLSRALFELMVPNSLKGAVADLRGLVLAVDGTAAAYPWELMRDVPAAEDAPLATRVGLIRQLASPHGRHRVPTNAGRRALVIGDTMSGMVELQGAQAEASVVTGLLRGDGYEVIDLYRAQAHQVFVSLFDGEFRFMHLAGHGVVGGEEGPTGMVLGGGACLTTAQICKLERVPEFVFINCCHLGSQRGGAGGREHLGKLAANLATGFIELGCRAVIAAGWEVDDQAGKTFARVFYTSMLGGYRFGEAVRRAREQTCVMHPAVNTWGAYQAYGDERYMFPAAGTPESRAPEYLHQGELLADLDLIAARIVGASSGERADRARMLEALEKTAGQRLFDRGEVLERLASIWADLGDRARAIKMYRAAFARPDASASLRAVEQLANLEIRHGLDLVGTADPMLREQGRASLQEGCERLRWLIDLAPTAERFSLLASSWKRRAQMSVASAGRRALAEIREMTSAYWQAAEASLEEDGEYDYYPLLNALDGTFLLAARGEAGPLNELRPRLEGLLDAARRNAVRRYRDERSFFHAITPLHCELVEALWSSLDGGSKPGIVDPLVRSAMARRIRAEMQRLGSKRENDSVAAHIAAMSALLPRRQHELRAALEALRQEIAA